MTHSENMKPLVGEGTDDVYEERDFEYTHPCEATRASQIPGGGAEQASKPWCRRRMHGS